MERAERLVLREELRVKLDVYDSIIRRLQFEKLALWQLQLLNEQAIGKLEKEQPAVGEKTDDNN